MTATSTRRLILGCALAIGTARLFAQESRIAGPIRTGGAVALQGNVHSRAVAENDRGALDPATPIAYMRISLAPSAAQAADLERLLEAQRDPGSADYHRWLTPEEFGDRFGLRDADVESIAQWLEGEGFHIEQRARASNWIAFSGTAGQVAATFRTELRYYEADGERHFANASAPYIPRALAGVVSEIHGLNDFRLQPPRLKRAGADLNAANGAHYLAPDDLAAIYDIAALYKAGYDGSGQKLAIVGQSAISLTDLRAFRSQFGLAAKDPQLTLYGSNPGVVPGDTTESELDLEWAGAVARNASIVFVYSTNVFESLQYAIDQNLAPVVSMSYGSCELGVSASNRLVAQQANAQGITWVNSSGDSGAAGCDWGGPAAAKYGPAVTFPADIPEVTAVGGTEFNESGNTGWSAQNGVTLASATGYLPEKGWNDTAMGQGIWASGGGASVVFPKPWWQTGPGVPADKARDVPDVSLTASADHDGYAFYFSGQLMVVGGTSASAPAFAGLMAILNQYLVAKGVEAKPGLGNVNPALYNLVQNATGAIHDVTNGDNIVPCVSKSTGCATGSFGYKAGAGYDQVTGVGSVDAFNLVTKWANVPAPVGTTMTLAASPNSIAQSSTTQLTAKVTPVTGSNAPTGSVSFAAGATALGSAPLTVSGSSASASLTVKGSSLNAGADTITATYAATGSFSGSTATATVTVTAPPVATKATMTASLASLASNGTEQLSATVTAASGSAPPAGTVTFVAGSVTLGTATLAAAANTAGQATGSLSVSASKLAMGANSVTASYAGSAGFTGSVSAPVTITVTAPLVATAATLSANPTAIAQSASTVLTVTIKPASGTAIPGGSVTFTAGNVSLGSATLAASGANATASLTVKGASLAAGNNTVSVSYTGDSKFSGSSATVVVTVTAPQTAASNVVATVSKTTNAQPGFAVKIQLQETAGAATKLTGVSINGVNMTPAIGAMFGGPQIAAHATLTAVVNVQWSPLPATLVFVFTGSDASGKQWTQTVSLATK